MDSCLVWVGPDVWCAQEGSFRQSNGKLALGEDGPVGQCRLVSHISRHAASIGEGPGGATDLLDGQRRNQVLRGLAWFDIAA